MIGQSRNRKQKEMRIIERFALQSTYFLQMLMGLQGTAERIRLEYSFGMGADTRRE